MSKLVNLKIEGKFDRGFSASLEIQEEAGPISGSAHRFSRIAGTQGKLAKAPEILEQYRQWQGLYRSLQPFLQTRPLTRRPIVTNASERELAVKACRQAARVLENSFNRWLESQEFRPIVDLLLKHLQGYEEIRLLLQTDNIWLRKLPWQQWDLLAREFPQAEIALSSPEFQGIQKPTLPLKQELKKYAKKRVKILAILGHEVDARSDVEEIEKLADRAEIVWLERPQREELDRQLWTQGWDILFWAGHSSSSADARGGNIWLNEKDKLEIEDLRYGLKKAIDGGLRLAIFNSCDGLGLAHQLAEGKALYLPQIIVMREDLPKEVAPKFLRYFLEGFVRGESLYAAVREARRQLHSLENDFPCASWLPVICQNPAEVPPRWIDFDPVLPCPYRGLSAFREQDAPLFFGREAFAEKLVGAVREKRLIAVVGDSGSGKSSVVFAGLIPRLREESVTLATRQIATFRPQNSPFDNLAAALLPFCLAPVSADKIEAGSEGETGQKLAQLELVKELRQSAIALAKIVETIVQQGEGSPLLLVADQFEELYTLCAEADRQPFLDGLLNAVDKAPGFTLVLTLRVDFLGRALSYDPFGKALQQYPPELLIAMNREELAATIVKPAQQLGVELEPGLTDLIINDAKAQPGRLPLLQFALTKLWQKRQGALLSREAYAEICGVELALARYAEKIYNQLNPEKRELARRIFIQLVRPGEGTEDTRRLATRAEVGENNWDLVTQLADARLVVTGRNEKTGAETVEIVHEALIQNWRELKQWIDKDREFRSWQERLRISLDEWESKHNKDPGALLRGAPLAVAERFWQERPDELSEPERIFIEKSLELRDEEIGKEKRRQRQRILGLTGFSAAALVLAGIATVGWYNSAIGQINTLTQSARSLLASNLQFDALLEGLRAAKRAKQIPGVDSDTKIRLAGTLNQAMHNVKEYNSLEGHTDRVESIAFSPDGQIIATASDDNTAKLWSLKGELLATLSGIAPIVFSPDGQSIATASWDNTVKLWSLEGKLLATLSGHASGVLSVAFSPDGGTVATASYDDTTKLWSLEGKLLATLSGHKDRVIPIIYENALNARSALYRKNLPPSNNQNAYSLRKNGMTIVAFSPNGQRITTFSRENIAQLWSVEGELLSTLSLSGMIAVVFSPDGQRIATTTWDNTAELWSLEGELLLATLSGHTDIITSIAFSPNGQKIATASRDNTTKIWSLDGKMLVTLSGHGDSVLSIAFSPNGQKIATASNDNTVKIWSLEGELLATLSGHTIWVESVAFSPDGQRIATVDWDSIAKIWSLEGELLATFSRNVTSAAFSPDGQRIATASWDNTAKLWSLEGELLATLSGHTDDVESVAFSPDGQKIATAGGRDNTAKLWSIDGELLVTLSGHTDNVERVALSPDRERIATASYDKTAKLWSLEGELLATLSGHSGWVTSVAFSPNGETIATASDDKTAKLWNIEGELLATLSGHSAWVTTVAFSPDGQRIATATWESAKIWSREGELLATLSGHRRGGFELVAFSPDSRMIATASYDNTAKIWSLEGELIATLSGHTESVKSMAFSPDGQKIATAGGWDNTAKIWSLEGELLATLSGHTNAVSSVVFRPDGETIATASYDRAIKLWSLEGKLLATLSGHTGGVLSVAFSPDGQKVATASQDDIAKLWILNLDELMVRGCDWVGDYLKHNPNVSESDRHLCD